MVLLLSLSHLIHKARTHTSILAGEPELLGSDLKRTSQHNIFSSCLLELSLLACNDATLFRTLPVQLLYFRPQGIVFIGQALRSTAQSKMRAVLPKQKVCTYLPF
jgi:hypothetical protein